VLPHLQAPALLRLLTIDFPGILGVEFVGALMRHTGSYTCTLYEKGFPWVDKDWNLSKRRDAELLDLLSRREMYTFLYPLDACHPDPSAILPGNVYPNRTNS